MNSTRSGRQVKKVGQSENKSSALANLAKLRKGEGRRTDQYEVNEGRCHTRRLFWLILGQGLHELIKASYLSL